MNNSIRKDVQSKYLDNIRVYGQTRSDIGYVARTNTKGQEFEMVKKYLNHLVLKYGKLKNKKVAIFIEPQLDTGYPDIVIVEYFSLPTNKWEISRSDLTCTDLKILFYIQGQKNSSISEISHTLGYPSASVEGSLKKLSAAGMVYLSKSKKYVRNVRLETYCRIHKIIAIEAKIDKWKDAIRQASNNVWFATESYILINKESCSPTISETCKANGIGIILVNGTIKKELASTQRRFPVSYASLQFNEWILRDLNSRRENNDNY